jgi:hypothetical protein
LSYIRTHTSEKRSVTWSKQASRLLELIHASNLPTTLGGSDVHDHFVVEQFLTWGSEDMARLSLAGNSLEPPDRAELAPAPSWPASDRTRHQL